MHMLPSQNKLTQPKLILMQFLLKFFKMGQVPSHYNEDCKGVEVAAYLEEALNKQTSVVFESAISSAQS